MTASRMRFGIFLAPFHPTDEDPDRAFQRDFELMECLDSLGYDEAWIGEHHSAGFEIIASPELFIAAAAWACELASVCGSPASVSGAWKRRRARWLRDRFPATVANQGSKGRRGSQRSR